MRKKILIVSQHFWPESFRINDICDYLAGRGCDIDVLCGIPNYPQGKFFDGYSWFRNRKQEHGGAQIRRALEVPRRGNSNPMIFINYLSFPLSSLFHLPRLMAGKYDRIFIYQTSPVMMALAGLLAGKLTRTETIMYVGDLWPQNLYSVFDVKSPVLRRLAAAVSAWHYRQADKLIANSTRLAERLGQITSLPEDRIAFIPQCCEKFYERDAPDAELERRFAGGFNIVYAGNISPAQSFETVIASARRLKEDGVRDINWIIVGDGMSRPWLESAVAAAGLAENFFFEGQQPAAEIPRYHTIADALLACLVKSDLLDLTIPSKVLSYFAAGKPLLLAMDGEAQTLVREAGCGFAAGSGDSGALYENIRKLRALPAAERQAMGARGRDYHFRHFERNANMDRLYDFVFDLITEH